MKAFMVIWFVIGSAGLAGGVIREYIFYPSPTRWWDARNYCKQYYRDMATITTAEEQQRIVNVFAHGNNPVWIGLYRDYPNWKWSDGEQVSFLPWSYGFPIPSTIINPNDCAYVREIGWGNYKCVYGLAFYCYRHLTLVNESKTWEEALQHCKTNYISLASLPSATQVLQAKTEMALTQTESVWTSLRYIDGKWFWVNGETVENQDSLLPYPAHPYRCGALNNRTNVWENRDCNEKLNFLCYFN